LVELSKSPPTGERNPTLFKVKVVKDSEKKLITWLNVTSRDWDE